MPAHGRRRARTTVATAVAALLALWVVPGAQAGDADAAERDPVIVAVGDLVCPHGSPGRGVQVCRSDLVANLITDIAPDRFLALGDLQYEDATLEKFQTFYDAQFGHLRDITAPVPGNHEYAQEGASGYFAYFGERAHPPGGYYSFDLGSWHLIALNSQSVARIRAAGQGLRSSSG